MPHKPSTKPEKKSSVKKPVAPKKTTKSATAKKKNVATSPTVREVMSGWERRELEQKETVRTLGEQVFDGLAKLGVTKLLVEFDGHGDSGELADIKAEMSGGKQAPVFDHKHPLYFDIENLVCGHLNLDHPGWELEGGSFGSYELDVTGRATKEKEFTRNDEDEENRGKIRTLSEQVFDDLMKLGVTRLLVEFGSGEDPMTIGAEMSGSKQAPVFDYEHPLYFDIEDLINAHLDLNHPDGVDDDSSGSYELDVARRETKEKEFNSNNEDEEA